MAKKKSKKPQMAKRVRARIGKTKPKKLRKDRFTATTKAAQLTTTSRSGGGGGRSK